MNYLKKNNDLEQKNLDATANSITDPLEAVRTIRYEEIIKTQNKRAVGYVGKQGQPLKKFREIEQFLENVEQSKSIIYFKIGLY